jgi:hypothetical protein
VVIKYCRDKKECSDIIKILEPHFNTANADAEKVEGEQSKLVFVYLVRGHPGEYKIGRTNLVDRRLSELGATASIEQELIHEKKRTTLLVLRLIGISASKKNE